jgi:signal transduction histidine kinase
VGSTLPERRGTAVLAVDTAAETASVPATSRLMQPPALAQPVVDRFAREFGGRPVWMWPIRHAGRLVGGVLFSGEADQVSSLDACAEELEALSGAFGLALVSAATRAQTETLLEELADVNRRLQAAQEEVLRAKSLGMVAAMAAGAAHELNNPLAVISGRAQMLAADAEDPAQEQTLRTIHEQAQRASRIVSELLAFAKPDPPRTETITLVSWLEGLRERWLARSSLDPARIEVAVRDPGPIIRADPAQLEQIFENLLANALEATRPEKAHLVINSTSRASDETVVISVGDNGRGMTQDVLDHALDPFFSHRPAGRGRGLGLSLAYSLALANGGRLWLESTPDVGTTVFVELPAGGVD